MHKTRFAVIAFYASALASPAVAQTWQPSALSFGLIAGRSTPVGTASSFYRSGYQLGGLAELRLPVSWIAMRVDGGYQALGSWTFPLIDPSGATIGGGRTTFGMFSGTASAVLRVPNLHSAVRPYGLASFGSYWLHNHASWAISGRDATPSSGRETRRTNGSDVGVGLEAPLAHAVLFAETRYQRVGPAPFRFVPISAGVRLR